MCARAWERERERERERREGERKGLDSESAVRPPPSQTSQDGAARRVGTARVPRILRRCDSSAHPSLVSTVSRSFSSCVKEVTGSVNYLRCLSAERIRCIFRMVTVTLFHDLPPLSLRWNLQCCAPWKCVCVQVPIVVLFRWNDSRTVISQRARLDAVSAH